MEKFKVVLWADDSGLKWNVKLKKGKDWRYKKVKCDILVLKSLLNTIVSNIFPATSTFHTVTFKHHNN